MSQDHFRRYELKYSASPAELHTARALIAPFMRVDPHGAGRPGNRYTVRSIYFDTLDLRFYHEKEAGVKIRKKLRIRTYNRYDPAAVSFLEIKRKNDQSIFKERVGMPLRAAQDLLGMAPTERGKWISRSMPDLTPAARASFRRFFFLEEVLMLRPTVLVVYDREAYVGRDNPRVRVTFDCGVRSIIRPGLDEIFTEQGLRHLSDSPQILEIKFDGWMPPWLRPLTALLNRANRPISKYCRGIDLWIPAAV